MTYGYYGNKKGRKQSRSKTKQLELRRILASLTMAAGILAYPFGVSEAATAIVRKDGTVVNHTDNVYNINPEGKNSTGDFAYNRFQQFALDAGQIVNLQFDTASTLANLVNNRVTINGIVNAVKGGAIDGHLIFLSPNGIAVGSSGVINAGQFTGIVPTPEAFNTLYNTQTPATDITLAAINQIKDGAYAAVKTDDEGVVQGTIEISGQINTHSGVMLGAGIINIKDGAKIQSTKNLDFTNLVNIQSGANAGLGTLTKVEGSGGDIILGAKQVSDVKDTKTVQDTNNQETTEAHAIRWSERSTDLSAAVNIGKDATTKGVQITSSAGAVKLTAESTSTYKDSTPMTLTGTMKTAIFGSEETAFDGLLDKLAAGEAGANKYLLFNYSNKKNKSAVNIGTNSTITGNSIDVAANSKVEIKQSVTVPELPIGEDKKDSNGNVIPSGSKVLSTVTVSRVDNKADIVVDGNLKATGADEAGSGIKIAANADTKVELAAGGNGGDANAVAVGVAVLAGDTKANVVVNDKVTENAQPGENDLSATAGKVSVEATTGSDIDVNVVAKGTQSYVVSNVGVANYDTNADVTMNRNITAGAVDIKAENKITGLKLTVDNTVNPLVALLTSKDTAKLNDTQQTEDNNAAAGEQNSGQKSIDPTKVMGDASVDTSNTQDTQTQDAAGAIQKVKNAVEGTNGSGSGSSGSGSGGNEPKTSAFGLGASVGVFSNKNDAKVTIAKNVAITATKPTATTGGTMAPDGSVNISAKTIMSAFKVDDTTTAGSGTPTTGSEAPSMENENSRLQFKVKNTLTNAKVKIGAAVLVSNVKNDATVVLDSDGTNAAKINGGAVSLNAAAGMEKYPVPPEKEDGEGADAGTGAGSGQTTSTGSGGTGNNTGSTESGDGGDEPEEKIGVLTYTVSAEGTSEEPSTLTLSGSVGINTLKNNAIVLLGQNSEVTGSEVKLSSDATTGAVGLYGPKELSTDDSDAPGSNAKVGIGASVGIQNIRGNSLVIAGKGVKLTGTESLEVSANNGLEVENKVQKAGKGDSVGISGMVALSYGDSNSIVSIDDEAAIAAGFTTITSTNSTNIDNSARTESKGNEGAKAFGIGVGIINYDINSIAMVGDNGSGLNAPTVVDAKNPTDTEKAAQKIYEDTKLARDVAGSTLVGKLGASTASGTKGTITTGGLVAAAVTTGMIQNDAKANATAAPKEKDDEDSEKWTKWSKQGTEGANAARTDTENLEQDNVESQNESDAPSASAAGREAGNADSGEGGAAPSAGSEESGTAPNPGSEESAGASIGIEGSAALTFLGGRTDAVLDNVTIQSVAEGVPAAIVSLSATDFLGSITLGGTSVKNKLEEGDSATEVGIGGTFAMSSSKRDVDSVMRNTDIPLALIVSNSATKIGIEVAAGLGVSTSSGDGTNVAGAGVVYYNKAKQDVHALMLNDTITGLAVSNQATGTDFQIAGGIAASLASGSGTNVGAGGTVAISHLENNLSSGIVGGNYNILSLDVEAQKGTTQINGALAGGKSGYGFEGAFAYGSIKNATHAYISDGANVTSLLPVSAVNVKAGEIPVVKTKEQLDAEKAESGNELDIIFGSNDNPGVIDSINDYDNGVTINMDQDTRTAFKEQIGKLAGGTLENEAETQKKNKETLEGTGIDTTGKSYLDTEKTQSSLGSDSTDTDGGKIADEAAGDEDKAKDELGQNRSITITAAMAGALGSEGEGGAGIAYNYVKNDIAADIKGSTITAGTVNGEAATDSLIVSVGAGIAVGGKTFNGAGSGSWNDLKNDTRVSFDGNTITGTTISEQANNTSSIINIAGEVAGGKGMAIGLTLAYNSLNNTTGTYLTGNTITLQGDEENGATINLATMNHGKALAVSGGVDVEATKESTWVGANGNVAINRGVNNNESVIDGKKNGTTVDSTTITGAKDISVKTTDVAKKTTVAGGISVGGKKVGVGGAVAYTSIGSNSNKEKLRAEINHANITTAGDGAITVSAVDSRTIQKENNESELEKSRITTVGAGFAVGWGKNYFNLQGAAAVSDIYKDSRASLNNTNINANSTADHPAITVEADTKSKINTVGAVGQVSVKGVVTGTVGIAINRMNQDTVAEMATDKGTTTANAGLTQVRATGDGDIHSVGVGATVGVGEKVTATGSGSHNYIGNNVRATIKNQNLTSNSSIGVVAQSDDSLYNFAGGFSIGANTNAALGTAASVNKITGNTEALVQGGSLKAADTGSITYTRPNDDKLFKAEAVNVSTTRDGLSSSRTKVTEVTKTTGIVVDSSATHTLISQLSSGGVAAASSIAVSVDGTVNLNTIAGETTAKIKDADLNSSGNPSNINVNAVDYSNLGTFTGTPAIGAAAAAGVSIGVSADWETLDRKTIAEISSSSASAKKNVYAKNLTVDATAKHGSSTLSFAAAAGGGKIGVSSGDSIVRHKNTSTTSAKVEKVNAIYDGAAEIKADHLGNSFTQNISVSVSAGMVAVAAGAGVSVMDDTSKVTAEVANSELKAKESTDGKNISVLANNENNWKNLLVTASLGAGIGAGVAANVGIYNTTGETAALVTNSDLEAYNVNVNATDKMTAHGTGGVGGGGVGGVGVAVTLNNINSSVSSHVTGGTVTAAHDINVKAEEERSFDSQVTGAAAGGIGVGVNVAVTSINKGITNAQLSNAKDENNNPTGVNADTQNQIKKHLDSVNAAKGALGVEGAKIHGLSSTDIEAAKNMSVSLATPTYDSATPDTRKMGVHTEVSNVILTAGNNVKVTAKDTSDIFAKNIGVTAAGAASINVTDAIIHTNYDTDVTMNKATVTGKNVNINALQTQADKGSEVKVTAVTVGALASVGVGYAGIVNRGATDVNITDSNIKSTENVNVENVTIEAKDESKHQSQILSVGVAALNVTTTFASVENYSNVGVTLGGTNNISAGKDIAIDAKKANALEAHTQGVGVGGVNVAVNHATIEDGGKDGDRVTGNVTAKITGTNGTFTANSFHLGATNDTTAKLSAGSTAVSVLGVSRMRGKGVMNMGADVSVAGGNFNAGTVEFASTLGNANGRTLEGNVKGHNISAVAVAPDVVALTTEAAGTVNVANSTFGENTNLILDNESYVDRKAYIYSVTAGAVAVGNTSADIFGKETLNTSLTGKVNTSNKLASLQVGTYGENKGKAFADAGGGSLVGYIGAHVRNDSINNVTSTLGGKWETTGDVWLVAAQKDETRLTASEGHGGIAGVGGTSVDNYIDTTTEAKVENNTEITADRTHIGTGNAITTGAYDDTNEKGATDAQTFTMKDHFGGVISGNRLRSLIDVKENGTVTIGDKAKITTNHLQEYIAASENNLTNLVEAKGGGAIAVTDAVSEFDLKIHNNVNVGSGATLSNEKAASTEDITIAAYDNLTMKSQVDGTVYAGVISPIVTKNIVVTDRQNSVNVAGNIESGAKAGLYAGANKDGVLSNLKADLKSGAYNYSVISITTPRVRYNKDDDDKDIGKDLGTVDVSGIVRATGDINVIASSGKEEVVKDQSLWNWALGGSSTNKTFLTSDAVVAEEALPKDSRVIVTGSLIAGTADPINLTIGGSVANGLTITAPDNRANNRVKNGVKEGTFDYANTLAARWDELDKMIKSYDAADANLLASYMAERDRIQNDMIRLGLAEKNDQGQYVYTSTGRPVYFVEVPDIATGGGNINVTANDFTGTGNLRANASPGVTITNKSDAYLKLNNILMGEQGGKIVYNDKTITPNTTRGNTEINGINVKTNGAEFSEVYGVTNGEAAGLLVENKASGPQTTTIPLTDARKQQMRAEVNADKTLSAEEKNQWLKAINEQSNVTYTSLPDVEVNGKISNFYGNVTISNTGGDIRISGGTTDHPTGVKGNTVKLIAPKGSIAQSYKAGIVNINGDPEKYLADNATALKNSVPMSQKVTQEKVISPITGREVWAQVTYLKEKVGNKTESYTRSDSSQTANGYIAGRDVYVSAANININGLIQSGYKNYTATVTQADLDKAKSRPADKSAVVQNRTMFKVNEGGAKWNSTDKVFDYVPQVYWDPSTKQLFVEDIDTSGGKVYLTGKLSSTGDGRILAADGAADISVVNQTSLDMNVGKVLNNQREGVITAVDMSDDSWMEFRKGQTREIRGYTAYMRQHGAEDDPYRHATVRSNELSINNAITVKTAANQTYNWAKGEIEGRFVTKQHHVRYGMWGLVKTKDMSEIRGDSANITQISNQDGGKYGLPDGATIQQNSANVPEAGKIRVDAHSKELSNETTGVTRWLEKTGFLGWFKNYYTRWTEQTTTLRTYNYSINASQPITIGLIGSETGSINISSTNTAGGSINLKGNVANSHNQATLNINSAAGGITQFDNTTLKSEIVNLTAKDDIKNIHLASVGTATKDATGKVTSVTDNIKLSAVSTGKGDINITAVGGILENRSLPGNVEIVALKSQDGTSALKNDEDFGDVILNATGNITQSGTGLTVQGRGITLTSQNGGIGTANQAVNIAGSDLVYSTDRDGAQINASAKNSIYLSEAAEGGDMRVGKIESREGDVKLTVRNGSFIDALPADSSSKSTDSVDEMVHRWIDAGLIDGEKDAQGNYTYKGAYITGLEKSRDDYKANVEAAYDPDKGGKTQAQWQADYNEYKASYDAYVANRDKYANYDNLSSEERQELDKNNPGGYENYKSFSAQKAAYDSYLANRERFANLSESERETLEANGDSDYKAYKYYSKFGNATADEYLKTNTVSYKYSQHTNANAYLANDVTYTDLVAKAANPTFEWTKDMMLYAVSDKMVNPDSGGSIQTERAANVLGKNVTLTASQGAVGTFDDQTTTITVENLKGNESIKYMKQLLNVSATDVTVKRDASDKLTAFEIRGNMPLGVKTSGTGTLNVQAGGNVFVAGRKDANGEYSAINVGSVDATQNGAQGDVRLHSDQGIYNAKTQNDTNIIGNDLILTGGKESIGTSDKPLTVFLTGDMTEARADKNVFIKNMNNNDVLRLGAMLAKDTISLTSDKGFAMSSANAEIADSYINAGKTLEFNAENGIVGEEDNPIRILNDRAPVNITAQSAHIRGVGNSNIQNGTMLLGTINTMEEFTAVSDGSLSVGREEETDSSGNVVKAAVEGAILSGGEVSLGAMDNLTLDGSVIAVDQELTLAAFDGYITQTDKGVIITDTVNTFSDKTLLLENAENQFNNIIVDGLETESEETPAIIDGDVRIKDNSDALTVAIKRNVSGDISVENLLEDGRLTNSGNLTATGNISLASNGNLTQAAGTTFTAGKEVKLTSTIGSITQNVTEGMTTGIQAQKVTAISTQDVNLQGMGNQFGVLTVQSANETVPIQGNVLAKDSADKLTLSVQPVVNGDITVENTKNQGVIQVTSELKTYADEMFHEDGNITLKSDGSMQIDKAIAANLNVALTSINGAMTIGGDVSATTGYITLQSKEAMQTIAALTADNNVTATSENGAMTIGGDVTATYGDIRLESKEAMQTTGVLTAGNNVSITSGDEMSIEGDVTTTEGDITLKSDGDMQTESVLTAGNSVSIISTAGAMSIGGDVTASGDSITVDANGTMKTTGDLEAASDVSLISGDAMTIGGDVTATTGNITMESIAGMDIGGAVTATEGVITLQSKEAMQTTGVLTAGDSVSITSTDGVMTVGGDVTATNGNIMLQSDEDMQTTGTLTAGADVNVTSVTGDVTTNGAVSAEGNVALLSSEGAITTINTVTAVAGDIEVTAEGNMETRGTVRAGGNVALLSTEHAITVNDTVTAVAGNINATAQGDVTTGAKLSAEQGAITITSVEGTVAIGKEVKAQDDVTLKAESGAITTNDAVTSVAGNIEATALGDMDTKGAVQAQNNVTLLSEGGAITTNDTVTSVAGDIKATALGDLKTYADVTAVAGSIEINAQGDVTTNAAVASVAGNIEATARGKVETNGAVKAGGNVTLLSTDDVVTTNGTVTAAEGNIEATAKGDVTANDKLSAEQGAINLTSNAADVAVNDETTAKNDVTLKAEAGSVIISETVTSTDENVVVTAEDTVMITADVTANEDVTLTGTEVVITPEGALNAEEGDVSVTAKDDVTTYGIVQAGSTVSLRSTDGAITINETVTAVAGDIEVTAQDEVETNAAVTAGSNVSLLSTEGAITINETVTAVAGDIEVTARDEVETNAAVTAGSNVSLLSTDGAITIAADIEANQNVVLTSESAGITQIATAGIQAQTVTTASAEDVDLQGKGNQFGTMTVQSSDENVGIQGSVLVHDSADKLVLSVQPVVNSMQTDGDLTAANDVKLSTMAGAITTNAAIMAEAGNIEVTAQGDVTTNAAVMAEAGNIEVTAQGDVTTGGELSATEGTITLTSEGGDIAVGNEAMAQGNVALYAEAGSVAINGALTSIDENVVATAEDAVTITANIEANQDVTLTSESAGITQTATAGIQAQTVTTASAEGVDLQGIGNQFGTITVQSSDENVGIQGSVLVHDSADKLVLSVQPVVNIFML